MKRLFPVCLTLWLLGLRAHAGPTEAAIVAAMRLSEQPNYSWVATISDDARTYDIHGRTVRGGFTRVKMPVINSVRRQLGRGTTDTQVEMIFRGNVACVIETDTGWSRPDELSSIEVIEADDSLLPGAIGPSPATRRRAARSTSIGSSVLGGPSIPNRATDRGYSNLQLAISHPHEELGVIVSSHQEFRVEGEVVTGTLTDLGAQLLLVRDGQESITPRRASGTFKLWLRDGVVVKYQLRLEGTLSVRRSNGHRDINVQQVSDTIIKEIGTTRFEVPLQASVKLGG